MAIDWLMRMAGFERKASTERAGEAEGPYTWPMWYEGRVDPTPSTLPGFARQGYSRNAIVYACISRKATSAAMAAPMAYTGERDEPERLPDDAPLSMLLRRPNRWMSWYEMQELLITYMELDGNAYLYKARTSPGQPATALFPLRPDRVRPIPKNGELLGYVYDGGDTGAFEGKTPFLPDEIVHIKYPNPMDPFEGLGRGQPPLAAAVMDVDLDNQAITFLTSFFRNAAVPFGLLKTKQKLLDNEVTRIRERVRHQYSGSRNWHDIMILDADADYQRLGLSMTELEFDALDSRNESRICAVVGVPPIIAGARVGLIHGTYSNYREARQSFWEDTLIPLYLRFDDALNLSLESDFKDSWIAYDFSRVPALQTNEAELHERAVKAWSSGLATRDEARAMVNLPPGAEDGFISELVARPEMTVEPMWRTPPDAEVVEEEAEEEEDEEEEDEEKGAARGRAKRRGGREGKPALQLDQDDDEAEQRARDAIERAAADSIADALDEQRKALIPDDGAPGSADEVARRVEATSAPVRDALRRALISGTDLGVSVAVSQFETIGFGFDWTLANTQAREWANRYSGELISRINETTVNQVRQAVGAWVENGDPLSALVRELEGLTFGRKRAAMIAATEVTRSYAEGNLAAYRATGIVQQIEWRIAEDEIVCPICAPLAGTRSPVNNPLFGSGAQGIPPAHPNCRCFIVPVVDAPGVGQAAPVPEVRPRIEVPAFKTQAEAIEWGQTNGVAHEIVLSKGVKLDGISEIYEAVLEVHQRFGSGKPLRYLGDPKHAPGNIRGAGGMFAGYVRDLDSLVFRVALTDKAKLTEYVIGNRAAMAQTAPIQKLKDLVKNKPEKYSAIADIVESMTERRWVVGDTTKDTIYHEMGHRLNWTGGLPAKVSDAVNTGGWKLVLSEYAKTTEGEWFAESFNAYMKGETDRLNPEFVSWLKGFEK